MVAEALTNLYYIMYLIVLGELSNNSSKHNTLLIEMFFMKSVANETGCWEHFFHKSCYLTLSQKKFNELKIVNGIFHSNDVNVAHPQSRIKKRGTFFRIIVLHQRVFALALK